MFEPSRPYLSPAYTVKSATEAWEFEDARTLRRQVFCHEQGLFAADDADAVDAYAIQIVAVNLIAGEPDEVIGVVRIHQEKPGVWWGSRLAVDERFRRVGALGASLIRFAVGSARGMGCQQFLAHVQAQNRLLFERLNWTALEAVTLRDWPHLLMEAHLDAYPVIAAPRSGPPVHAKAA
ncbi:MAG TPA: MSMEG_0567/Sll0786 family nitrogen starvation N-acetyltransferase [Caulobacteraceae bacterium]|jgi:putative N-acetyltransferase (TIGR04045 family)